MEENTKNLSIEEYEDKETKSGKPFTRFKTNKGWLSCFNKKACDAIKKFKGESVQVVIKQSGDFENIEKFVGAGEEEAEEEAEEKSNIKLFEKIKDALLTIPGIDPDDFLMELMNINNEVESN